MFLEQSSSVYVNKFFGPKIPDLVMFIMCILVSRVHMTFYVHTKGSIFLETRDHMAILTRSKIPYNHRFIATSSVEREVPKGLG